MAVIFLSILLLFLNGNLFPENVSDSAWSYLIVSGIIGLTLGDLCLFSAFVVIGTRLTLLIFASSPIIAALIAWPLLDEGLGWYSLIGIIVTILGIVWVISERSSNGARSFDRKTLIIGILLSLGGAAGQAIGLVLAKKGMTDQIDPLNATLIRMLAAGLAAWLIGMFRRDNIKTIKRLKDRTASLLAIGGSITGPFLGVWMSLVAVKYTSTGIAAAIMATVPVLVIPLVIIFYKEKITARAIIGALIAAGGVAILFLS